MESLSEQVGVYDVTSKSTKEIADSTSAGFAAASYEGNSETVIAFRGTDFDLGSFNGLWELGKDMFNGWLPSWNVSGDQFELGAMSAGFQPAYAP